MELALAFHLWLKIWVWGRPRGVRQRGEKLEASSDCPVWAIRNLRKPPSTSQALMQTFFFFDAFKGSRITSRCFYGHRTSGGVRKVADSFGFKNAASFHCKTQTEPGVQRKGLVLMDGMVPSIPLQACAGVWRSCWSHRSEIFFFFMKVWMQITIHLFISTHT